MMDFANMTEEQLRAALEGKTPEEMGQILQAALEAAEAADAEQERRRTGHYYLFVRVDGEWKNPATTTIGACIAILSGYPEGTEHKMIYVPDYERGERP